MYATGTEMVTAAAAIVVKSDAETGAPASRDDENAVANARDVVDEIGAPLDCCVVVNEETSVRLNVRLCLGVAAAAANDLFDIIQETIP